MSYTAIQEQPIVIDLTKAAKETGWSIVSDNVAGHESCNSGFISLTYPIIAGKTYQVSYSILNISGGNLQLYAGTQAGAIRTVAGFYVETIVAAGTNPQIRFYSNANCRIQQFNLQDITVDITPLKKNTIVFNTLIKKWTDFRDFIPDIGFSLGINSYTFRKGRMYAHLNGGQSRNNFYGQQYTTHVRMVFSPQASMVKTFIGISYQANTLMVTPVNGISTSLGQVSELLADSFLHDTMVDGGTMVNVYATEGLYESAFLRDKNVDIINGDPLKGDYIQIELTQPNTAGSQPLALFTVALTFAKSFQNIR